jgi:hypothetical protein
MLPCLFILLLTVVISTQEKFHVITGCHNAVVRCFLCLRDRAFLRMLKKIQPSFMEK